MSRTLRPLSIALVVAFVAALSGCGGSSSSASAAGVAAPRPPKPLELGEVLSGRMTVIASRPDAPLEPGKTVDVRIWIGCNAADPNPTAVRAWIGSENVDGSTKTIAELAPPSRQHHYQALVAVPAPLPADARLYVEIDDTTGAVRRPSFDLRR